MTKPFAVEASWVTGKWDKLDLYLSDTKIDSVVDFNVGVGLALLALHQKEFGNFERAIYHLRGTIARSLSAATTTALQTCHDSLLKFHVLTELETISGASDVGTVDRASLVQSLDQRLNILGAFSADKQYVLGLRRAAMQLSRQATFFKRS